MTALNFFDQIPELCKYLLQAFALALRAGEGIKAAQAEGATNTGTRLQTHSPSLHVAAYSKLALLANLLPQLPQAGEASCPLHQCASQIIPGKVLSVTRGERFGSVRRPLSCLSCFWRCRCPEKRSATAEGPWWRRWDPPRVVHGLHPQALA